MLISTKSDVNTDAAVLGVQRVERAISELRCGRFVEFSDKARAYLIGAVDTLDLAPVMAAIETGVAARVVISGERARAMGFATAAPAFEMSLQSGAESNEVLRLAGLANSRFLNGAGDDEQPGLGNWSEHFQASHQPALLAALELARLAALPPAMIFIDSPLSSLAVDPLIVDGADIAQYPAKRASRLRRISSAQVPLAESENAQFIVFREYSGLGEHVAIVIDNPDLSRPVPVRLHSACLTGDLFGSLRCDCGEQLRRAVSKMQASGGGVLLYLAQEGRGIGLANKLRAYQLQGNGFDTLDADQSLGFRADERNYAVACSMLHSLEITSVVLMTNNPTKIAALEAGGISVEKRSALLGTANPHNARYMQTKQDRAGHLSGDTGAD